jgi:hypothetical protein
MCFCRKDKGFAKDVINTLDNLNPAVSTENGSGYNAIDCESLFCTKVFFISRICCIPPQKGPFLKVSFLQAVLYNPISVFVDCIWDNQRETKWRIATIVLKQRRRHSFHERVTFIRFYLSAGGQEGRNYSLENLFIIPGLRFYLFEHINIL